MASSSWFSSTVLMVTVWYIVQLWTGQGAFLVSSEIVKRYGGADLGGGLLGGDDDPKYQECQGQIDADASGVKCSKSAVVKYPNADDQNRCNKQFYYTNCIFPIACNICTSVSAQAWILEIQIQLDSSVNTGKCRPWASHCPHLSNCPSKSTSTMTTSITTKMTSTTMSQTTVKPFPMWAIIVASVISVIVVVILLALVLYLVFKPRKSQESKSHALKLESSAPRTSTGKVARGTGKVNELCKPKNLSTTKNLSITKNPSGTKHSRAPKNPIHDRPIRTSTAPKRKPSSAFEMIASYP